MIYLIIKNIFNSSTKKLLSSTNQIFNLNYQYYKSINYSIHTKYELIML